MPDSRLPYFPALDGIRALAVAAVLAFHGGHAWASGGYLGVSTFFTLSGFLITTLLLDEAERRGRRVDLAGFWTRRFRRLMPAALLALLGVAVYGALVADAQQLWRLRADSLASLFYVANWRFMLSGRAYEELFGRPSPVQHFWSLSIEEQFYVGFPILLLGIWMASGGSRRRLALAFGGLALASTVLMAWLTRPEEPISRVYYGTDTRAAELLVGALLAAVLPIRRSSSDGALPQSRLVTIAGLVGAGVSLWLWGMATQASRWLFEGGLLLYAICSAALVAAAVHEGPLQRVLAARPLRALGRISYGVYLYHWPLYLWLDPATTGLSAVPLFVVRVAATLGVSTASYHLLEQPIRTGRRLPGARVWVAAPLAVAAVSLALVAVTRNPEVPASLNHPHFGRPEMPARVTASGIEPPRIVIFGDSVAWSLGSGLASWGRHQERAQIWNLASFGCGLTHGEGAIDRRSAIGGAARCPGGAAWWKIQLDAFDPEAAFVMAGLWDLRDRQLPHWSVVRGPGDPVFDAWLLDEFSALVEQLRSRGIRVVWLNHPCISPDPAANIANGPLGSSAALDPARIRYLNDALLPQWAARYAEAVELVDLDGLVCPDGRFEPGYGKLPDARPDGVHFTPQAARRLAEKLGPAALRGAQ